MDNKADCFILGAKAFFNGVYRSNCTLKGWRKTHWLRGWDSAHDGEAQPDEKA